MEFAVEISVQMFNGLWNSGSIAANDSTWKRKE
jgi:hypothetical protein